MAKKQPPRRKTPQQRPAGKPTGKPAPTGKQAGTARKSGKQPQQTTKPKRKKGFWATLLALFGIPSESKPTPHRAPEAPSDQEPGEEQNVGAAITEGAPSAPVVNVNPTVDPTPTPSMEQPAEETPVKGTLPVETQTDHTIAQETTTEETTTEETTTEETTTEEDSAEETPAEETPAEEVLSISLDELKKQICKMLNETGLEVNPDAHQTSADLFAILFDRLSNLYTSERQCATYKAEKSQLEARRNELAQDNQRLKSQVETLQKVATRPADNSTLRQLQDDLRTATEELETALESLDKKDREIAEQKQRLADREADIADKDNELAVKNKKLADAEEDMAKKDARLRELSDSDTGKLRLELEEKIAELARKDEEITADLAKKNAEIESGKREIEDRDAVINTHKTTIEEKDKALDKAQAEIKNIRDEKTGLSLQIKEKDKALKAKDEEIASAKGIISARDKALETLESEKKDLADRIEAKEKEIEDVRTEAELRISEVKEQSVKEIAEVKATSAKAVDEANELLGKSLDGVVSLVKEACAYITAILEAGDYERATGDMADACADDEAMNRKGFARLMRNIEAIDARGAGGVQAYLEAVGDVLVTDFEQGMSGTLLPLARLCAYARMPFMREDRGEDHMQLDARRLLRLEHALCRLTALADIRLLMPVPFADRLDEGDFEDGTGNVPNLDYICPNSREHLARVDRDDKAGIVTDIITVGYTRGGTTVKPKVLI